MQTTEVFAAWFRGLSAPMQARVTFVVTLLATEGVRLGFPYSSAIEGSAVALRELRVQAGGRPVRIFYAFDPARRAVLLCGGDKTGKKRFYEEQVREAERLFAEWVARAR